MTGVKAGVGVKLVNGARVTDTQLDVLLIAFNRPDLLAKVCEALRVRNDVRVYLSLDGPRDNSPTDRAQIDKCLAVACGSLGDAIVDVKIEPRNLGCAIGATSAISWFLSRVPEGVILEDDCVPTGQFLDFARLMLGRFRDDASVAAICGVNYAPPSTIPDGAIAFRSRHLMLWGWATWRRTWDGFDVRAVGPEGLDGTSKTWASLSRLERRDWSKMMSTVTKEAPHTWDYQLIAHLWRRDQEVILPRVPLVDNIGFESGAHYTGGEAPNYYRATSELELEDLSIRLNGGAAEVAITGDLIADRWISSNIFSPPILSRLARRISRSLRMA